MLRTDPASCHGESELQHQGVFTRLEAIAGRRQNDGTVCRLLEQVGGGGAKCNVVVVRDYRRVLSIVDISSIRMFAKCTHGTDGFPACRRDGLYRDAPMNKIIM